MNPKKCFFLISVLTIIMIPALIPSGAIRAAMPNPITAQAEKVPDISGKWNSSLGVIFQINQQENRFFWHDPGSGNQTTGSIEGKELFATWIIHETSQSVTGRIIEFDSSGWPIRIEWSNDVIFFRDSKAKMLSPIKGWCCKNGDIYAATRNECNKQEGKFFEEREQAEEFCRQKYPEPEQGFCCLEGEIFKARIDECLEKGGRFFHTMEEAEEYCRREHPVEGWCCHEGEVIPSTEAACLERGGRFFHSREEAEEFCRPEYPEPERGFCCLEGGIFESSVDECLEKGGQFFHTVEEAEEHCRREHPVEGWCCHEGEVIPSTEAACLERGGRFFHSREEAEEFCRPKYPEPERGFCCLGGGIFESSVDECLEKGGQFFRTMEEAEEHCRREHPVEGWCCREGEVFPAASEGCCRELGGRFFLTREEAEEYCRTKETPEGEYSFHEEYPGWNMPELGVTGLVVEPERANPGDIVRLHATVSNLGTGETNAARVVFFVDGEETGREPVEPLPPFGVAELTSSWTANGRGRHLVIAELEMRPGDFDGNPANNSRRASARVSGEEEPLPELKVTFPDRFRNRLISGEPTDIPVSFRNPSFAHIHNIPVEFFLDGERMGKDMIDDLPPGEKRELRFPWDNVTPGEHMISVKMDLQDNFPDRIFQSVKGMHVIVPDLTTQADVSQKNKWMPVGNPTLENGDVGRISDFAFHPTNPDIMYAVGWGKDADVPAAAGIWRSTNAGQSWSPIGDKLSSMATTCVAVDSKTPVCVYVGTCYNGIFKSIDSGKNWDTFIGPETAGNYVSELIVRSETGTSSPRLLIYAATRYGVLRYKSDDPWEKTSTPSEWGNIRKGVITDLDIHPTDKSIVYASVENDGLYRTEIGIKARPETESGNHNWKKVGIGLPPISGWNALKLDIYKPNPKYIYAGVRNPKAGFSYGIYRSQNGGDTFELMEEYPTGYLAGGLYNPFIRVHQSLLDTVYFGGVVLYKWSTANPPQGKLSWTYAVQMWRADMKQLKFLPSPSSDYYVACDQGMFRCKSVKTPKELYKAHKKYGTAGDSIAPRNTDLRVTQFFDFDVGTSRLPKIIGGTQDTGNILYQFHGGKFQWRRLYVYNYGDGFYTLMAPSNDKIMYAQFQDLYSTARSPDDGKYWQKITENKGLPEGYAGAGYITVDPNYPNTLLAVGSSGSSNQNRQVYATTDADLGPKCTWSGKGPSGRSVKGRVNRVVIQPKTTHWFASTTWGQIWHTSAKTQGTWSLIDSHHDKAAVISMAFSPTDPSVLYVLYGSGEDYRRIRRFHFTSAGGWNGTWIMDNLDVDTVPRVICGDGYRSDLAYVGTDHGVFRWDGTRPAYDSWQPYTDGLPLTTVVGLEVGPDKKLYAATKGRGVWTVNTHQ